MCCIRSVAPVRMKEWTSSICLLLLHRQMHQRPLNMVKDLARKVWPHPELRQDCDWISRANWEKIKAGNSYRQAAAAASALIVFNCGLRIKSKDSIRTMIWNLTWRLSLIFDIIFCKCIVNMFCIFLRTWVIYHQWARDLFNVTKLVCLKIP